MSIGRDEIQPEFKTTETEKILTSAKKVGSAFFQNPLHYIFYLSLLLLVVGLFFGKVFDVRFYLIIAVLAAAIVLRWILAERNKKTIDDHANS